MTDVRNTSGDSDHPVATTLEEASQFTTTAFPVLDFHTVSPLFKLIHGLPGSGKTKVMHWLRSYFEEVWGWTEGVHFTFLAPLNSMAANIGGSTLHSWGEVAFKDRRGQIIQPRRGSEDQVSSMAVKTSCLRFLFIDEIEASGCQLLNDLEERVSRNHNSRYKYSVGSTYPRPFAGINVLLFGDFWQLAPVGQVVVMQNPFADNALESAGVQHILQMSTPYRHCSHGA